MLSIDGLRCKGEGYGDLPVRWDLVATASKVLAIQQLRVKFLEPELEMSLFACLCLFLNNTFSFSRRAFLSSVSIKSLDFEIFVMVDSKGPLGFNTCLFWRNKCLRLTPGKRIHFKLLSTTSWNRDSFSQGGVSVFFHSR